MTAPLLAVDGFLPSLSQMPKYYRLAGGSASCLLHGVLLVLLISPFSAPSSPTPQLVEIEVAMADLTVFVPPNITAEAPPLPALLPVPPVEEAIVEPAATAFPPQPPAVIAPAALAPLRPSRPSRPSFPADRIRRSAPPPPLPPAAPSLPQAPPSPSTSDAPAPPAVDSAQRQTPAALPVVRNPTYRSPPTPPIYPRSAKNLEQQGTVIVRIRIDIAGDPQDVVVFKGSGFEALDKAAVRAAHGWRFQPAQRDGSPIPAWVEIAIHFHLT